MRITNQMMVNSSISNIQGNKSQLNDLSTQLSTQKKINKPSDDPIIAIRALRLRSSLDEVTQYLGKNIPDASSWLSVTHDALDESNQMKLLKMLSIQLHRTLQGKIYLIRQHTLMHILMTILSILM